MGTVAGGESGKVGLDEFFVHQFVKSEACKLLHFIIVTTLLSMCYNYYIHLWDKIRLKEISDIRKSMQLIAKPGFRSTYFRLYSHAELTTQFTSTEDFIIRPGGNNSHRFKQGTDMIRLHFHVFLWSRWKERRSVITAAATKCVTKMITD